MITKKLLSLILAVVMVVGLLPAAAFAAQDNVVYLSISFDSNYIDDKNGNPLAYVPVPLSEIEAIDLTEYGLENMLYDADGDGNYETTALQLLIYAHEELYGGDWGDVNFDALPGSSYFKGGIFGFTENLVYFQNGDFPVDESQASDFMTVGATSDRIVLEAGDFLDVASFECYSFLWDQLGGFHLFADANDNYTHDYTVDAGQALDIKLKHSFCDLMFGESWVKDAEDYEVYYGTAFGQAEGSVTTDESGNAQITFPSAGTYYVWCDGGMGSDDGTHGTCDHYMQTGEPCIVSSPAFAKVTVAAVEEPEEPSTEPTEPEAPRQAQDVSTVLNATMAMQAATVAEPAFGTNYGEWTVFGLARGGYYENDSQYFADYYDRIVEYVNTTAAELDMNGALDKNKSTDNSRLIMALASIGRDATSVGNWDLVEAYSANGINWIKKQGMNGTIWTLIALDCGSYETSDPTIRQQCVDAIVSAQHNDGGWSLVTAKTQPSNVDITGMTLTALYPYRDQPAVAAACETAFTWLSESQLDNGGFPYGSGETSESCVWAIVACATWGINPDTDSRFIKNGYSAVDNLLTYYLEDQAMFEHGRGAGANAMATDQATYGLVAYDRLVKGKSALYDYRDVTVVTPVEPDSGNTPGSGASGNTPGSGNTGTTPEPDAPTVNTDMAAVLSVPEKITGTAGTEFNAIIGITKWDNEAGYKLTDFIMNIPQGLTVTSVAPSQRLSGGEIQWNLEEGTDKLRVVYFDANNHSTLTVSGEGFPAELFTIGFKLDSALSAGTKLNFGLSGMSVKLSSDSADEASMLVVNTTNSDGTQVGGSTDVGDSITYTAMCLYTGDGVDLIPTTKKAIALKVTGISGTSKVTYNDGTNTVEFKWSQEATDKTNIDTYVALVDSAIPNENFVNPSYIHVSGNAIAEKITFGDSNADEIVNAQDALAAVNAWLRKGDAPTDDQILCLNVNGDSRLNTFDALGIVEAFVDGRTYGVVTKAATMSAN